MEGLTCTDKVAIAGDIEQEWLSKSEVSDGVLLPGSLTLPRIQSIATQLLAGLLHLHSHCIVHRDIKPANLLTMGDDRVCITDFGFTRYHKEGPLPLVQTAADGTPFFMAPELCSARLLNQPAVCNNAVSQACFPWLRLTLSGCPVTH